MQDVKVAVHRLDKSMNDNYQEILIRLRALEMRPSSSLRLQSRNSDASAAARISQSTEKRRVSGPTEQQQRSSRVLTFLFETELAISKVYRKVVFGGSTSSLLTTEDPKTRWSALSALTMADIISNLSVLNLAITTAEVYNVEQYRADDVEYPELPESAALDPIISSLIQDTEPAVRALYDLSIEDISWMEQLSDASHTFFQGFDSSWTESSSTELILRIFLSLNLPPSMMKTRWYKPTFFLTFHPYQTNTHLLDKNWACWGEQLKEDAKPLQLFTQFREKGWQPVLLLSVANQPYHRRGKMLRMDEVGYLVDGWVIDAELFRLSMAYMRGQPTQSRSPLFWI